MISVIMPAYNCELYVEAAIKSILEQTYKDFELVIADDASKDNTKKIIDDLAKTDARIKTFHNDTNLGYLQASNKLFEKCIGEYITFQDADDFSDRTRFEKMINEFARDKELKCVGSNTFSFSESIETAKASNFPLSYKEIKEKYLTNIVMTGSAVIVKKEVTDQIGLYNLFFDRIGAEDIYWYGRIIEKYKTINIAESLYYYRQNPTSVSRTHKNPLAIVSHDFCMLAYSNRIKGKQDVITEATKNEQDFIGKKLLAEYYIKKGEFKNAFKYLAKLTPSFYKLNFLFYKLFARQTIYHLTGV